MFSYISLGSNDLPRAVRFYDATMGSLGYRRCVTEASHYWDDWVGWGIYADGGASELALWVCAPFDGKPATVGNGTMIALHAETRKAVDEFHAAALAHGGSCEGAPGLRSHYSANFYAAYVRDPDGNKLAVVCRRAE